MSENLVGGTGLTLKEIVGPVKDLLDRISGSQGREWLRLLNSLALLPREVRDQIQVLCTNMLGSDQVNWESGLTEFLEKVPQRLNPYYAKFGSGILPVTTGKRNFVNSRNLFKINSYEEQDFQTWGIDVEEQPTEEEPFEIFRLVKAGTFEESYNAFVVDLSRLCWSQDQIITFLEGHYQLFPSPAAADFLFQVDFVGHKEFFVVYAGWNGEELGEVRLSHFRQHKTVWGGGSSRSLFLSVIPQEALAVFTGRFHF